MTEEDLKKTKTPYRKKLRSSDENSNFMKDGKVSTTYIKIDDEREERLT